MSAWNTDGMAAALSETTGQVVQEQASAPVDESNKAQLHGWAPKQAYDYESYAKSSQELKEAQVAFTGKKITQTT